MWARTLWFWIASFTLASAAGGCASGEGFDSEFLPDTRGPSCVGTGCAESDPTQDTQEDTCVPVCDLGLICMDELCVPAKDGREHGTQGQTWTVLLYIVADNNLEPFALADLEELMEVGSTDDVKFVVQIDRADAYVERAAGGLMDWVTTKRILVQNGSLQELEDLGETNMGDPAVLSDFLAWGTAQFPADRTALVFHDHGGGWVGFGGDESTTDNDVLSLSELRKGLSDGLTGAPIDYFSLLVFDACLMQTYETAEALKPFSEYMLASEELVPGHGLDYRGFSSLIMAPETDAVDLSKRLMSSFYAQAQGEQREHTVTTSLLDLFELGSLERAIALFTADLQAAVDAKGALISQARSTAVTFGNMPDGLNANMIDLGDLVENLAELDPAFASHQVAIDQALAETVVHMISGQTMTDVHGVSIYFPAVVGEYDVSYDTLSSMQPWREMLASFYSRKSDGGGGNTASGMPPGNIFTNSQHKGDVEIRGVTTSLKGALSPNLLNWISEFYLVFGVFDGQSQDVIGLGEVPGMVNFSSFSAEGTWRRRFLVLEQNGTTAYAYASVLPLGEYEEVAVPLVYRSANQGEVIAYLMLIFDGSQRVISSTYYVISEGGFGELYPESGSQLDPIALLLSGNDVSWVATSAVPFDATMPVGARFESAAAGTRYYLELQATDVQGNLDFVYHDGQI
jgi:hypothetical protein